MEFIKIKTIWLVDLLKRGAAVAHSKSCTLTDNLMKGKIQLYDWSLIIYKIMSIIL